MKLYEIAATRCGDKGDVSNVCVFARDDAAWQILRQQLTETVVREKFGDLVQGTVTRYEFPVLQGLNFVLTKALGGGVSMSLRTDPHGKSYADLMDDIDIPWAPEGGMLR
jgi:hypothetical protein